MGALTAFPIGYWRCSMQLGCMVETGTWTGDGVAYALAEGFEVVHSVEMNAEFADAAAARFAYEGGVTIWHGTSVAILPQIIERMSNSGPALWWLDAHLQDFYGMRLDATHPLPLKEELAVITQGRDVSRDVFLIDDLRIYEDIPSERNWPERAEYAEFGNQGIEFVFNSLSRTHGVHRDFRDEGYILALPHRTGESQR